MLEPRRFRDTSYFPSISRSPVTGAEPEAPIRLYLQILRKRFSVVLLATGIAVACAFTYSLRATKKYEAVSHLTIAKETNGNLRVGEEKESSAVDYSIELDTQASLLRSNAVALQVINDLNLVRNPAFNTRASRLPQSALGQIHLTPEQESALLKIWNNSLSVSKVPRTRMIEVRFTSPDPRLAARVVSSVTEAYLEHNFRTHYDSTVQATEWLSRQLSDLQLRVESSEQALIRYKRENDIVGLDEKQNITTDKLSDLNKDLTSAENDRMQKQALYQLAQREPENLPTLADNPLFQHLRETETELEQRAAQMSVQFGPAYPKVVEVNNELKQARIAVQAEVERAIGRAKIDYNSALDRERMLRDAFEQQKAEAAKLNEHSIEYLQLKRDAESNRALYDSLNRKLKEASLSSSLRLTNVSVVDSPRIPAIPSTPNVRSNVALALIFGAIGGVGLALFQEALDNTVRTPEQAEEASKLPSLGTIPLTLDETANSTFKSKGIANAVSINVDGAMIAHTKPKSRVAEAYRALRTSVLLSSVGRPPQLLMLTSALPQEGKTTTSINTAIVLAQNGDRVLLIDADMRRPTIDRVFGLRSRDGLSSVLSGNCDFHDAVLAAPEIQHLNILPAGPLPPNPAELLGSSLMREVLAEWRKRYDFIVIDTPPVLAVTDAVLVSPLMDAVMLVIRSGKSTKDALRHACLVFAKVNVGILGTVVNAVDLRSPEAHYYGYDQGYRESSGYYEEERIPVSGFKS